jgi:hypothetical protein
MTTKEIATKIREDLKQRGYNSRKISVRFEFCGYSSVVVLTVKDDTLDIENVREWVNKYEAIDRDERTGETLEGGNTYIRVVKENTK